MPTTDNYLEIANLIATPDFRKRVQICTVKNAVAILQISARSNEFPYCKNVIKAPDDNGWLSPVVYQVALDTNVLPLIDANSGAFTGSDSVINDAVKAAIPKFSIPS